MWASRPFQKWAPGIIALRPFQKWAPGIIALGVIALRAYDALRASSPSTGIVARSGILPPWRHPSRRIVQNKVVRYVVGHDARQVEVDQKEKFETI